LKEYNLAESQKLLQEFRIKFDVEIRVYSQHFEILEEEYLASLVNLRNIVEGHDKKIGHLSGEVSKMKRMVDQSDLRNNRRVYEFEGKMQCQQTAL
jgi:hypothetical protein